MNTIPLPSSIRDSTLAAVNNRAHHFSDAMGRILDEAKKGATRPEVGEAIQGGGIAGATIGGLMGAKLIGPKFNHRVMASEKISADIYLVDQTAAFMGFMAGSFVGGQSSKNMPLQNDGLDKMRRTASVGSVGAVGGILGRLAPVPATGAAIGYMAGATVTALPAMAGGFVAGGIKGVAREVGLTGYLEPKLKAMVRKTQREYNATATSNKAKANSDKAMREIANRYKRFSPPIS